MATLRSPRARALRNAVLGVVGRLPAFQRRMALRIAGLHLPPVVPAVPDVRVGTATRGSG
jgi:hypothetical protein